MFERWGHIVYRGRKVILALALVLAVFGGVWGTGVFTQVTDGGFTNDDWESARTSEAIDEAFGAQGIDVVVTYTSDTATVDDETYRNAVQASLNALPDEHVASTVTWFDSQSPQMVSPDRSTTFATVRLAPDDEDAKLASYEEVRDEFATPALAAAGVDVGISGQLPLQVDMNERTEADLVKAETFSFPILLVLLVVIFGSVVAAGMPLMVGTLAILGAMTALRLLTSVTDVSVFAINIVTILGLGLAIDYGLFVVARFREELARLTGGASAPPSPAQVEEAVVRTVATAGRTVAFSGVTVAISLASLLLFPMPFLSSMGLGGVAAVVIAMIIAITVLPAALGMLGHRVDRLSIPLRRNRGRRGAAMLEPGATETQGGWARVARVVMRRPVVFALVPTILLLVIASPFLDVRLGYPNATELPADSAVRQSAELLEREIPAASTTPVDIAVDFGAPVGADDQAELDAYITQLAALDSVEQATVVGVEGDIARVAVTFAGDFQSEAALELVAEIRGIAEPEDAQVLVGGATAQLADLLESMYDTLPWMALMIVVATFVLLFLAFGSVVLPVKAIVVNLLSITAAFGVMVWGFQEGGLADLMGFTAGGTTLATMPVLMFAILFGLSMDYEVFLLSRIREEWDATGDNEHAVAAGLQRSGGIITSAALLLAVVVAGFALSSITFLKMTGVVMIVAVLVDATIVRVMLVPATMRLMGRFNWWAPKPLVHWWEKYGIGESGQARVPAESSAGGREREPVSL